MPASITSKAVHLEARCDAGGCSERATGCAGNATGAFAIDACVAALRKLGWRVDELGGDGERWVCPRCQVRRR